MCIIKAASYSLAFLRHNKKRTCPWTLRNNHCICKASLCVGGVEASTLLTCLCNNHVS